MGDAERAGTEESSENVTVVLLLLVGAAAIGAAYLSRHRSWQHRQIAALLISAIVVVFPTLLFALTSRGVHHSWTGEPGFLDLDWLKFGLVFTAAWGTATLLFQVGRTRASERAIPILFAGILMAIGVAQVYAWEVRDANEYVSATALPQLRAELGPTADIPSEFEFEATTGTPAIVSNDDWLAAYNSSAALSGSVKTVDPTTLTKKQLMASALGFAAAAFVWFIRMLPWRRWTRDFARADLAIAGIFGALVLAGIPASFGTRLPALLQIGNLTVTVFELVKILAIAAFALSLTRRAWRRPGGEHAYWITVASVAVLALVDLGAGLTIGAIGLTMSTLTMQRRGRTLVLAAVVLVPALAPLSVGALGSELPGAASSRISNWTDPWTTHDTVTIENLVRGSSRDVETAVSLRSTTVAWSDAVDLVEQELAFRFTAGTDDATRPVIPVDPTDEMLLIEAEQAWTELGGYSARGSDQRTTLQARLNEYIDGLRRSEGGAAVAPGQDNFQLQRSLFALQQGRLTGTGLGQGRPEAIPTITEDLALVAWGEATGLVGITVAAVLILALADFAIRPIRRSTLLPALLLLGLGSQFALQAAVNAGGVIGALPFTGVPFPFISRSGTSAVGSGLAIGALIAALDWHRSRTWEYTVVRAAPQTAGLGAGFVLLGASFAVLMGTGSRLLTPGPVMSSIEEVAQEHLVVPNQWARSNYRVAEGAIVDRHGAVLVANEELVSLRGARNESVATSLSHLLRQLDLSFDAELSQRVDGQLDGPSLVTTIDADIQLAADQAFDAGVLLAGHETTDLRGAVVVLDVHTGDIIAMLSRPTFDLGELSSPASWARAEGDDRRDGIDSRYLNRAFHGQYPPGSTFKAVTAAAALESGLHDAHSEDFVYLDGPTGPQEPNGFDHIETWHQLPLVDGPPVSDANHPDVESWSFDLTEAFAHSCNVAFAEMGLELGPNRLLDMAHRFGFERPMTVNGLGSATSTIDGESAGSPTPSRPFAQSDDALTRTAFGQGEILASPLAMATVAAAVANDGVIMQPRVAAGLTDRHGEWIERYEPEVWIDTGMEQATLDAMKDSFAATVEYGTGVNASTEGVPGAPAVGGKTGTAEWGDGGGAPHSWFIGAFPVEQPRLAIAVIVEEGGSGGDAAAHITSELAGSAAIVDFLTNGLS